MTYNKPPAINPELVNGPAAPDVPNLDCWANPAPGTTGPYAMPIDKGTAFCVPPSFHPWKRGPVFDVPDACDPPPFGTPEGVTQLPTDHAERKHTPLCTGVIDYFIAALMEVAKCSRQGNIQHKLTGDHLQWAQDKSTDHADCLVRHLAERGTFDTDNIRHSAKVAWRALALLQIELQAEGAPKPRAAA